jgi:putative alpha-1,2-mannosidase
MGLYPVAMQPVYLLLSPRFDDVSVKMGNGTLRIMADRQGGDGWFVQSVKVNGVEWRKSWSSHEDLVRGLIESVLGDKPVEWNDWEVPLSPGRRGLLLARKCRGNSNLMWFSWDIECRSHRRRDGRR